MNSSFNLKTEIAYLMNKLELISFIETWWNFWIRGIVEAMERFQYIMAVNVALQYIQFVLDKGL